MREFLIEPGIGCCPRFLLNVFIYFSVIVGCCFMGSCCGFYVPCFHFGVAELGGVVSSARTGFGFFRVQVYISLRGTLTHILIARHRLLQNLQRILLLKHRLALNLMELKVLFLLLLLRVPFLPFIQLLENLVLH
jgi:hypothetical protein